MPGIDYRIARELLPLQDVLGLIDYQPCSRLGPQLRGPCPLHESQSPTSRVFGANLCKNVYHCFLCKAGGNALDLWAALTGQSLYDAVIDLCQRLNRPVPWLRRAPRIYGKKPMIPSPEDNPMPET